MEGDAGPQLAVHDHGIPPFYQTQFVSGHGFNFTYRSKQHAAMPGRFSFNAEASGREDHSEMGARGEFRTRGFEGFSFMAQHRVQNGSQPLPYPHEREDSHSAMPVDLQLTSPDGNVIAGLCTTELRRKQSLFNNLPQQITAANRAEDDAGDLALKLSPGSFPGLDELGDVSRHNKRFRPSSPGSQSPVCQVDDCHTDLKHAKDYHRRHKVCEKHSKAPHSLVQKVMQRFCQQCSRFHPLPEFDEGKRSCRRRLAGHNKRRRKTDLGTPLSEVAKGTDLLNVVAILSQLQAKSKDQSDAHKTDYEAVMQNLRRTTTSAPLSTMISEALAGTPKNPQILAGLDRLNQETQTRVLNYLAGLSRDALTLVLRNCVEAQLSSAQGRMQATQIPEQKHINKQNSHSLYSPGHSSPEDLARTSRAVRDSLPFLIPGKSCNSSGESDGGELSFRPNVASTYLDPESSPDSLNARPIEEQNFFPTESGTGLRTGEPPMENRPVDDIRLQFQGGDLNLSPPEVDKTNGCTGDNSGSVSDHSAASSSSGSQELTGRIIFKLCDPKRMSNMSEIYQSELQKWLSLSPLCLESCMRPGCILLTIFLSMPSHFWEELVSDLRGNLKRLVRLSRGGVWAKGRIVVQVGHQRALIINGKVKRIRFLPKKRGPLLTSVRPLAVVAGQQATLAVRGYNIVPRTRIICVYHGRYILHEVPSIAQDIGANSFSSYRRVEEVHTLKFPGGPPEVLGRCFIEVEHDFIGNVLPVIVADEAICSELRSLEEELDSCSAWQSEQSEDSSLDEAYENREAEAMHFLHELGWIFQSTSRALDPSAFSIDPFPHVNVTRFEGLLKYAVGHDWCAVVMKLLDLLFAIGSKEIAEVQNLLFEMNLLHQAVKRKCGRMVRLLLHYVPNGEAMGTTIFSPVMKGPEGLTPLHTAAGMLGSEDIVEALIDDPLQAGLHGWKSVEDYAGRTPEWYAQVRGNTSYLGLVERKLLKNLSSSVSITVFDRVSHSVQDQVEGCIVCPKGSGEQESRHVDISSFSIRGKSSLAGVCKDCRTTARAGTFRSFGAHSRMYRPLMMMMVTVATICATVALLFRGGPRLEFVMYSLKWDGISYGSV